MKKTTLLVAALAAALAARAERVSVPADVTGVDFDLTDREAAVKFLFGETDNFVLSVGKTSLGEIKNGALRVEPFRLTYPAVTDRTELKYDSINGVFRNAKSGAAVAPEPPMPVLLSVRRRGAGAAFYLNGNFMCERAYATGLTGVETPKGVAPVLLREPVADPLRFETVEYPPTATFPGAWSNATVKLTAQPPVPLPHVTGANADLGVAAKKTPDYQHGQRTLWRVDKYTALMVPAAEYVKAHVLCAVDPDEKLDRAFTVRLTTYGGDGRAYDGMMNKLVEFDAAEKKIVGEVEVRSAECGVQSVPLWLVTVPIDTGDISDIVHTDMFGYWSGLRQRYDMGRYLDLEILGRCRQNFWPLGGWHMSRENPDPNRPSAVHVFGVTLEKPGAELLADEITVGNIFHNDEKPETAMKVFVRRPGAYRLGWTIRDAESNVVVSAHRDVTADARIIVDLAQERLGWYQLDWTLAEGDGAPFLTHHAAFALLGRDTRTTGTGEGPYTMWATGDHCTSDDPNVVCQLLYKAGVRRGVNTHNRQLYKPEICHRWKVAPMHTLNVQNASWQNPQSHARHYGTNETDFVDRIHETLGREPAPQSMQLLWECVYPDGYQAPELIGEKPGKDYKGLDKAAERVKTVREVSSLVRRHFPEIRIVLGNSGPSSEAIAEQIRAGLPEDAIDEVGIECMSRSSLPERQCPMNYLAVEYLVETARNMGYGNWKPGASIECNSRVSDLIGDDNKAMWSVRDILVGHLWGFRDLNFGSIDAGNYYTETLWGKTGSIRRAPWLYPTKAYVGFATLTKILDGVVDRKLVDTGDPCVYLARFTRRDGWTAYALWMPRGEARVRLETTDSYEAYDFYGRRFEPKGDFWNRLRGKNVAEVRADGWVRYFLAKTPCIARASVVSRAFPADVEPKGLRIATKTDDLSKWKLRTTKDPHIEHSVGRYPPYRTFGEFAVASVEDEERGACLELKLAKPNPALPKIFSEYGEIELKEPIVIEGKPKSMGMWVKGNSGWGKVYFVLEDAKGRRRVSCGTRMWGGDCFDYSGRMSVDFTGWAFLTFPIDEGSSIPAWSLGYYSSLWELGIIREDQSVGRGPDWDEIAWPVKLVGVAFDAPSRPLDICERHARPQAIRLGPIGFYDF